jgi:hypothetical protein
MPPKSSRNFLKITSQRSKSSTNILSFLFKQIALRNNPLLGGVPGWVIFLDAPLKCPYNYEKDACGIKNSVVLMNRDMIKRQIIISITLAMVLLYGCMSTRPSFTDALKEENANFILYISNQSFKEPLVNI